MAIVGFDYNKISVEKNEGQSGKISVANSVNIKRVERNDISLGKTKQSGLKFVFEYSSIYNPNYAKILLGGTVLVLQEEKTVQEVLDAWAKDKKIKKEILEGVINTILTRCNIQSLILSNAANLPPPVPMPKVRSNP
ncbi:hypothetical protein HY772_03280 [Candidatus Woesearchaeota archaeon]|nr:hypothetical protein [Candidatus Woesearchaeota archaeon]